MREVNKLLTTNVHPNHSVVARTEQNKISVPHKNAVAQYRGGTVTVPEKDKPISKPPPPENHVAMMERKRHERHEIVTKNYFKAKTKYLRFQKEIKNITQASVRAAAGPTWYQELSNKQTEILNDFDVYLKDDNDMGTATSSRRALKSLGVSMFIPTSVTMDALLSSQLYPVKFLTAIKDYVIQKTNVTGGKINKGKKKFYSTEERILMSSILYLEFPLLIQKLDFCLQDPVPDKKLEYIKLSGTKQKPIKYLSPYLEPLPETEIPWTKMKEIKQHNVNVKKQKMRENAKAKKKQELNEMALDFEKKIMFNMKIKFPDHPLEKMFYDPPLMEKFKLKEDSQRSNENVTTLESVGKANRRTSADRIDDTSGRDADVTRAAGEESAVRTPAESREHAATSSQPSTTPRTFGRGRSSARSPKSTSVSFRESVADDLRIRPYGWLFNEWPASCAAKSVCSSSVQSSSSSSSSSSTDEDDANKTLVVMDADGSVDDEPDDEPIDDEDATATAGNDYDGGRDDTDGSSHDSDQPPGVRLNSLEDYNGWLENDVGLKSTIRMIRGGARRRCLRDRPATSSSSSSSSSGTDVTVFRDGRPYADVHRPRRNVPRTPSADPSEHDVTDLSPSATVQNVQPSDGRAQNVQSSAAVQNVQPSDGRAQNVESSAAVENFEPSDERAQHAFNTDGTLNLDAILAEFRKLPPWKQLKAVLQFLAILGDPIAGFPDLIDVGKLRRWYEIRLNMNRKVKSKANIMMAKSVTAWNHMTRLELSDVPVPKNPVQIKNKDGSYVDWDQINNVKFKIEKTRAKYITRLKHTAIDNARNTYPIMEERVLNSRLKANFKHIFYDYFPAKEDDCLFVKAPPAPNKFNTNAKRANR